MNAEWGDGRNFMIADRIRARIKVRTERAGNGPWRRCITAPAKETQVIPDEAKQLVLHALADRPSGPPGEEILAVLLAEAWDEGEQAGYENKAAEEWGHEQARNPYRSAGASNAD